MSKDPRDIILRPVVSEKSYSLLDRNVYTFIVAKHANKIEIKQAVEAIFSVKVEHVRTMQVHGKMKRQGAHAGRRSDWKKAVVTLKPEQKIELFEQI